MIDELQSPPIAPGRSCGKCSLCCKLLHVVELNKPAGKWCKHCRPGRPEGGCTIHETRPPICRGYACGWLMSNTVSEDWYPPISHMVLSLAPLDGILTCTVTVDPNFSGMWKREPYYSQLKAMAYNGLHVSRPREILLVQVRCDARVWLLTDKNDIDISKLSYVVKLVGDGHYGIELFNTQEEARERVQELMQQIQ
jgi:hypothetical protein